MSMIIRRANEKDYPDLVQLSYLFETSPFTFDKRFRNLTAQFFPTYAVEIIKSQNTISLVAEYNNRLIGFISVAFNPVLSKNTDKSVGSILLLSVMKEYRGSGVSKLLVESGIDVLQNQDANLITVGTDIYNIPAIQLYESLGFRSIMCWHIFRYYANGRESDMLNPNIDHADKDTIAPFLNGFTRPISVFKDRKVETSKLSENLALSFVKNFHLKNRIPFEYFNQGYPIALLDVVKDEMAMRSLMSDKNIYRIVDLIVKDEYKSKGVEQEMLSDLTRRLKDYHVIELWVSAEEDDSIHAAERAGYELNYTGLNLHKHIG